ncbi:MAG: metallophosphoesterase family protein [Gemmatimonadota bacterium]
MGRHFPRERTIPSAVVAVMAACTLTVPVHGAQDESSAASPPTAPGGDALSFVVVGHPRGERDGRLYPRLDELLARIEALRPDLVFLTGDLIWGAVPMPIAERAVVESDWERLDARLGELGVPVHRVPGNHDIHDPVTRDVFRSRYGDYPRTVTRGRTRFLLLNSTYVPRGDDPVPVKPGKTVRLDSVQVAFIREELAHPGYDHTFLLMHHVLWWEEEAPWWQEVHPHLVGTNVRAVFAGDVGPSMFTHVRRDGIEYLRSAVNAMVDLPLPADRPVEAAELGIRRLQFENFLYVTVDGPRVAYGVQTVGALASGAYSPERWRAAFGPDREVGRWYDPATLRAAVTTGPPDEARESRDDGATGVVDRVWGVIGTPKRLAGLLGLVAVSFVGGLFVGRGRRSPGGRPACGSRGVSKGGSKSNQRRGDRACRTSWPLSRRRFRSSGS